MVCHTWQQAKAPSKLGLTRIPKQSFKLLFDLVAMPMPHANHAIANLVGLRYGWSQASQCPSYASAPVWECICFCNATLMSGFAKTHTTANESCSASLYFYTAEAQHAMLHGFLVYECCLKLSQILHTSAQALYSLAVTQHQYSCHMTSAFMSHNISIHVQCSRGSSQLQSSISAS